jgi:hypothetical protein
MVFLCHSIKLFRQTVVVVTCLVVVEDIVTMDCIYDAHESR